MSLKGPYSVDMVQVAVNLETRHLELAAVSFRTNFISIFLLVSDVYISTSTDFDPCTVCGPEVNIVS
jgi:hypothetical protein